MTATITLVDMMAMAMMGYDGKAKMATMCYDGH
jgi:hypothetical protein